MKIGYVRVSKQELHQALQINALKEAGCEQWSTVSPYFPSSNAMPKMSASSAVVLTRQWVISSRIRADRAGIQVPVPISTLQSRWL